MFPETIETDRLVLDRLTMEHLFECYEHASVDAPHIEEITRHLNWSPHRSLNETRTFIERQQEVWEDGEGATYVVYPQETEANAGEFGGTTGLGIDWKRRVGTLGLWLRKPLWGRGYSGERADALLELAFERLDLDLVTVSHHPDNDSSQRAIRKYVEAHGGRREGQLRNHLATQDGTVMDVVRYSIAQSEYRNH
ncbi:GNAT family N-acetyltransferase [Halocatena salina]|uniref:GNAT family N-acetyltransferase n=1 Tax=Halocatena salina TaxID=2934340 RepID=A0A8U0A222_9EURY|nr:GNAT family protein [Halocatena salina]UPM43205.1 GNAT family N-acetyltransferase [Halocatena salina]